MGYGSTPVAVRQQTQGRRAAAATALLLCACCAAFLSSNNIGGSLSVANHKQSDMATSRKQHIRAKKALHKWSDELTGFAEGKHNLGQLKNKISSGSMDLPGAEKTDQNTVTNDPLFFFPLFPSSYSASSSPATHCVLSFDSYTLMELVSGLSVPQQEVRRATCCPQERAGATEPGAHPPIVPFQQQHAEHAHDLLLLQVRNEGVIGDDFKEEKTGKDDYANARNKVALKDKSYKPVAAADAEAKVLPHMPALERARGYPPLENIGMIVLRSSLASSTRWKSWRLRSG